MKAPLWIESRSRTATVKRTITDYRNALVSTLRYAKSLALVDPYFNSYEPRFFNIIAASSDVMGQRSYGRTQGRIYIHAKFENQKPQGQTVNYYLNEWKTKIEPLAKTYGHHFKVFLWDNVPGKEVLHDRYILTDQIGVLVPGGLDCSFASNATTEWALLDEITRSFRISNYDPATRSVSE
jgi:hypothetical protein